MTIYAHPTDLTLVANFNVPRVKTWGSKEDEAYKEEVRQCAAIPNSTLGQHDWFAFSIRCVVSRSRERNPRWVPDVENMSKLIVDALTGLLYPDDNLNHVHGVQVEVDWGPDAEEHAEVWIFGKPKST